MDEPSSLVYYDFRGIEDSPGIMILPSAPPLCNYV